MTDDELEIVTRTLERMRSQAAQKDYQAQRMVRKYQRLLDQELRQRAQQETEE